MAIVIRSLQEALEAIEAALRWLKVQGEPPKVLDRAPIRLIPDEDPEDDA